MHTKAMQFSLCRVAVVGVVFADRGPLRTVVVAVVPMEVAVASLPLSS